MLITSTGVRWEDFEFKPDELFGKTLNPKETYTPKKKEMRRSRVNITPWNKLFCFQMYLSSNCTEEDYADRKRCLEPLKSNCQNESLMI